MGVSPTGGDEPIFSYGQFGSDNQWAEKPGQPGGQGYDLHSLLLLLRGCTKSLSVGHCGVETEYRNFTFPLFSIGCNIQK